MEDLEKHWQEKGMEDNVYIYIVEGLRRLANEAQQLGYRYGEIARREKFGSCSYSFPQLISSLPF
jgi:hypothetical protein